MKDFDLSTAVIVQEESDGTSHFDFDISTAKVIESSPKGETSFQEFVKGSFSVLGQSVKDSLAPFAVGLAKTATKMGVLVEPKTMTPYKEKEVTDPLIKFFSQEFASEEEMERHPVARTIGTIGGSVLPFVATAPLFPVGLLGSAATFGLVGGISEVGVQEITSEEDTGNVARETLKGVAMAPIWHYANGLKFIANPLGSALTRAGVKGVGATTVSAVFGDNLEEAFKNGGVIMALSLMFEAPMLAKTALGRQIVKEGAKRGEGFLKAQGKTQSEVDAVMGKFKTKGALDAADEISKKQSILDLVKVLHNASKSSIDKANNPDAKTARVMQITGEKEKAVNNIAAIAKQTAEKSKAVEPTQVQTLDTVNPTGRVFTEYSPQARATMPLGKNITTLDKTMGDSPDKLITIYRGAPFNQKEIVAGDFVTTNKQLAKDYAGDGIVIEKQVKLSDILDDITEPLGEEYIYRPVSIKPTQAQGEAVTAPKQTTQLTESQWDEDDALPQNLKPKASGRSTLEEKLAAIEERKVKREVAQEALDYLLSIKKKFVRRIAPFKKGVESEEMAPIPREYLNKNGSKLDEVLDYANESLGLGLESTGEFIDYLKDLSRNIKSLRSEIAEPLTKKVTMTDLTFIKQRIADVQTGMRKGTLKTKADVKLVQEEFIKNLSDTELDTDDKGVFLTTLKNIQTKEQLEKAMPAVNERVNKIIEKKRKSKLIDKFKDFNKNKDIAKLRPEYRDKVKAIISQFDPAKISKAKAKDLQSLSDFLSREPDNNVPQWRLDELKRLDKKPLRDMTADEVENIVSSIGHLIKLNNLKNKIIVKNKIKDFVEVKTEALSDILTQTERLDNSISGLDSLQKTAEQKTGLQILGADSYNAQLKLDILGGKEDNVLTEVIYKGIDRGVDTQLKYGYDVLDFFRDKLKDIDIDNWSSTFQVNKSDIKQHAITLESGDVLKITPAERISFYLHTLADDNMRHLRNGGISFPNTQNKIIKLTESDIKNIANLSQEEKQVADAFYEYYNRINKDALNKVSVELDGFEVATEESYFRIRTNYLDRYRNDLLKGEMGSFSQMTLEGMGMFKQRQNASNAIVLEDVFSATMKSIKDSGAYIGLAKPLRSAKALLFDNDIQKAAIDIGRGHYVASLKEYLRRVEGEIVRHDNLDSLTQELINKLDVAILGINPFVIMKQPVSYLAAATEMNWKYLQGNFKLAPTAEEMAEINKYAPQLRDRFEGNITTEVGEVSNVGKTKMFFTGKMATGRAYMKGILEADKMAVVSIWRSVKQEIKANNPSLTGDDYFNKVYERANDVIIKTQPTFHVKDRSTIGAKKELFWRLLTKYSSQRNKNYMIIRRAVEKYNRSYKTPKDKSELYSKLFIMTVLSSVMIYAIDKLRDFVYNRDDAKVTISDAVTRIIGNTLGNVYVVGQLYSSGASKVQKGTFSGYDINDIVTSTLDEMTDTIASGIRTINFAVTGDKYKSGRNAGEAKFKSELIRTLNGVADLTGKIKGVPIANVRKFVVAQYERLFGKKKSKSKTKKKIAIY
jgi:hypothetical protein